MSSLLLPVLSKADRKRLSILIFLWGLGTGVFFLWWFSPEHVAHPLPYSIASFIILWNSILPGYFFYFLLRMKIANPHLPIPHDWRVAMVVTKAPSEPWQLVRETIEAMLIQKTPHDTWLADEHPTDEVRSWCNLHGVKLSTRYQVGDYHRATWPRRTKCKEGNLAYFYDHYAYDAYDIVVQLDADHRPQDGYLEAMIRPFTDPSVGYVSSPSICNTNEASSWAARGRLYAEATLHGPLQAGYSDGWAPLCIGSHYAIRTSALKTIGGLGPELAEDHSTTFLMNAHGFRGVHALNAIAHGDGPSTFADAMTQEYQWSKSLVVLLLTLTPGYIRYMSWNRRIEFLFGQMWYPIFSIIMLISFFMPLWALIFDVPLMHMNYVVFLLLSLPPTVLAILIVQFCKTRGLLRPYDAKIISWEAILFQYTRWPWVLLGCYHAVIQVITRTNPVFKVTPKGSGVVPDLTLTSVSPYISMSIISALVAYLIEAPHASGYYYFALLSSFVYGVVSVSIYYHHYRERSAQLGRLDSDPLFPVSDNVLSETVAT